MNRGSFRFTALAAALALILAGMTSCGQAPLPERLSDRYRNYYEIFVRSFYDSDGDGYGDLNGVTGKLDYVTRNIGADGIWLMPIMPSPSYHKYDITDYYSIDPQYGTLEDFDNLIREAGERDVAVIIDLVINHTSNLHPWFSAAVDALWLDEESPYIDYYNFTKEDPGQGYSRITDRYFYESRFVSGMPDLNLDSPAVRSEFLKIAGFWLDRGVAGFRLDAVTYFYTGDSGRNMEFLSWLNNEIKAIYPDAYLIGEAWSDGTVIAEYYKSGLDSFFNFPWSQATGRLTTALNSKNGAGFATSLQSWNDLIRRNNPAAMDALFLANHDMARSAGFLMRDPVKQKMAASLYLLAPGSPFIYYGEELGMTGSGIDENKRLPMHWSENDRRGMTLPPPNATHSISGLPGADSQIKDSASLLNHYRQLLQIKAGHPEIARGVMEARLTGNVSVAAFTCTWNDRVVYVVHNLSDEPAAIKISALSPEVRLVLTGVAAAAGKKPSMTKDTLNLPALSTAILRRESD